MSKEDEYYNYWLSSTSILSNNSYYIYSTPPTTTINFTNATVTSVPWLTMNTAEPSKLVDPSPEVLQQIEDAKNSPHVALIGYRAWTVVFWEETGPMLSSIRKTLWPYRQELRAEPFDFDNHYNFGGIHAARSSEQLQLLGYGNDDEPYLGRTICGEVYLWGRIIHGEMGFRAEYAYPKNLVFRRKAWWADLIAEKYGIDYRVK